MRGLLALTTTALTTLAAAQSNTTSWTTTKWDIIVVGAGPAGIIVANRMAEAGKSTLLIEQGGPSYGITGGRERPDWLNSTDLSRVDVPGLYKSIFADQGHLTCQNFTNSFTGCTVGGSSAINAGLFFQPPASDFDDFFPEGWKYKDVNASINRVYATVPNTDVYSTNKQFYLQSGYELARDWIVNGAGFKDVNLNAQANDKTKVFGRPVFDYANGQRGGPVTNYLQTALPRSNFHLQINTQVKRVARNGTQATGVIAIVNGTETLVGLNAGGRVILSGGALQSPQILMYSGIGDPAIRDNLTAAGILNGVDGWINNTAVGQGLFDNPNTFIELSAPAVMSYTYSYASPPPSDAALYVSERSGPYSFASETSAFWTYINHTDGTPPTGLQGTIDSAGFGEYMDNNTITLNVYGTSGLLSTGHVTLDPVKFLAGGSSDVYYSNPRDAQDIAQFIFDIFQALNSTSLRPLNIAANSSVDQIREYITSSTQYTRGAVQHWSSSCRIGSCVDVNTVVKGTSNIHVVDASIVAPLTVNPQFGVMIAAERASELILALGGANGTGSMGNGTVEGRNGTATNGGIIGNGAATSASPSAGVSGVTSPNAGVTGRAVSPLLYAVAFMVGAMALI